MINAGYKHWIFFIAFVPFISSCDFDDDSNVVLTEEVIYVSSETVRLGGRIVAISGDISDHGFEIADNDQMKGPIRLPLGTKVSLGFFTTTYDQLNSNTQYYVRAFAESAGSIVYGDIQIISTQQPSVVDYSPKIASPGNTVTITANSTTSDVEVFFYRHFRTCNY